MPDFRALSARGQTLCVWAFDLLHMNGRDLRELLLLERKARLGRIVAGADVSWLKYSESFEDAGKPLAAADAMKLEGIVSKRRDGKYRSGTRSGGIKVKAVAWREANRGREPQ
jgi:bifunctional non-homologous end joining protein LigD